MRMRIGKVTNIYPTTGKVKVVYEDEKSASLPLAMLTMNQEYFLPTVGDRVVTMHMENGSSKGFVLGTYYGGGMQPKANSGYRKDFGKGAYVICEGGIYQLSAVGIVLAADGKAVLALKNGNIRLTGAKAVIGSAEPSEEEGAEEAEPEGYLEFAEKHAELRTISGIDIVSEEGEIKIANEAEEAYLIVGARSEIRVKDLILRCAYGEETLENLLKRLERMEDQMGLPHTI